ncbi:GGDEF domain-containing protein [soil metagenome]
MATSVMLERVHDTQITAPRRTIARSTSEACLVHMYPTGTNMGKRFPLGGSDVFLGRGDDNQIRINDNSVSRRHAKVVSTPEGYFINDLQSTNGTFVNDTPASNPTQLRDGNHVRVGNCIYKFLTGGNIEADYHEEIYRLTIVDALTDIHNRRYLVDFLDRELARSIRHERPLSVIIFDIDRFKLVNDTHGHLSGDFVLRELSLRIRNHVRREDLFARSGGEEFCMILVETPLPDALEVAERVRKTVEEKCFTFESNCLPITISLGVASTTGERGLTAAELLKRADEKLYVAKNAGRNRVES